MEKEKKKRSMKQKIIRYVFSVAVILGFMISAVMIFASFKLVDYVLLDTLQMMAKTSSQNVSANLHLLTDRMAVLALEEELTDDSVSEQQKSEILQEKKSRIEFVWLAAYDLEGRKIFGDSTAPASIANEKYHSYIKQTNSIVIGEPYYQDNIYQLAVAVPLKKGGETRYVLVGSYKYDLLNDVLSSINLGVSGGTYMINEEGIIIADKEIENIRKRINVYDVYGTKRNTVIFNKIKNRQTGSASMHLPHENRTINHYVAYSPVPGTNWALIIDAPKNEFMGVVYIAVLLCIALSTALLIIAKTIIDRLAEKISVSLQGATKRLEALSEGNLKAEVLLLETGDEVEDLTNALSKTICKLECYISAIRSSLGEFSDGNYAYEIPDEFAGDFTAIREAIVRIEQYLNKTMKQVNVASVEISENSGEVSEFSKQLYHASSEQTNALERLRQSIEIIMGKSDQIDDDSKQVAGGANDVGHKVLLGNEQMDFMLTTMHDIHSSMEEISKISQMMEQIANQSRMLSLNASIEAARAGEAGKGFAIVAGEMGSLSNQTAVALKQTSEIVERSGKSIEKGLDTAKAAASSLQEINTAAGEFAQISENLTQLVTEQKEAIVQVTEEIKSIYSLAVTNQSLAKQTDKKTEQFLSQAQYLKNFVSNVTLKEE